MDCFLFIHFYSTFIGIYLFISQFYFNCVYCVLYYAFSSVFSLFLPGCCLVFNIFLVAGTATGTGTLCILVQSPTPPVVRLGGSTRASLI